MRLGKIRVGRRAVSPVIATLLMIAIAVAASILVYVWSMGLVGTLQGGGGKQTTEQIILEAYDATKSNEWTLYLRNVGSSKVTVSALYINGTAIEGITPFDITIGGTYTLKASVQSLQLTSGAAVPVKIVTATGAVFSFSVIVGKAS
ncbi:MAG: archaellin/type IV pilin N-terminal domain-containing protein [Candidatus Bathyarchaeia archaeon]